MNRTPPEARDCTPAEAIAHALDDHWLTTPPSEPIYHSHAAAHVLTYLDDHGYVITRSTPMHHTRPISRATLALTLFLALACLAGATHFALAHDWIWAAISLTGTALFTREAAQDITALRHNHRIRTRKAPRP